MSSASYLHSVLEARDIDICGIAEHWLYEKDLHFLDSIHPLYTSFAVSDRDLILPIFRKRAKGGVALMWKRSLDLCISPLDIQDDRIIGIRLQVAKNTYMFIVQVYLPTSAYSIDYYKECIEVLRDLHSVYSQHGDVIFMGDFNCDLRSSIETSTKSKELLSLLETCDMFSVNTRNYCTGPQFTCVSYGSDSTSMLDYIIIPSAKEDVVAHCEIADDMTTNVSNHRPVWIQLRVPQFKSKIGTQVDIHRTMYNWDKANGECIQRYADLISDQYSNAVDSGLYGNSSDIDAAYNRLVTIMTQASDQSIPTKGFKPYLKPYWNETLKCVHKEMAYYRRVWIRDGRIRESSRLSYQNYKKAKCLFRKEHRTAVRRYLKGLEDEVDRLAEVDQKGFYKLVNIKRKRRTAQNVEVMHFGNIDCRDPAEIVDKWGEYFQELYSPKQSSDFHESHYSTVCSDLEAISVSNKNVHNASPILDDEVEKACKQLATRKAGGIDCLTNEHLRYGGPVLYKTLADLFTAMLSIGHVPVEAKRGVILTLYKGGGKRRDSPDSYRAITLTPVIIKLLERILLHRVEAMCFRKVPHSFQNGFLPHMNSTMTSFVVMECIRYAQERGNKLFAAFMDAEKAFDNVWINGLFWKLDKVGITGSYWNTLRALYTDMHSCVLYGSRRSKWFPVLQGTRQGGVMSPWLFSLYINEMLEQLHDSGKGVFVRDVNCTAPTQADDLTLLAYSKPNLDSLLNCCYIYACKWRLTFNTRKCVVIVFNEPKRRKRHKRSWHLGNSTINEVDSIVHLGYTIEKNLSSNTNVSNACQKARGSFLGLTNCGLHAGGFNPLSSKIIYNSVVLPTALYGSELWTELTSSDILKLERVQHFCVKVIQGLSKRTRSDMALGLLGMPSLLSLIHRRQLNFLGALCNLKRDCTVKRVFLMRLFSSDFVTPLTKQGFIQNSWRLLRMYGLEEFLMNYMERNTFPSQCVWKRIVRTKVSDKEIHLWECRMESDRDFNRFHLLHDSMSTPSVWWQLSRVCPNFTHFCRVAVRLSSMIPGQKRITCRSCGENTDDVALHIITCDHTSSRHIRDAFWMSVTDNLSVHLYVYLDNLDEHDLLNSLLGLPDALVCWLDHEELCGFMKATAIMIGRICALAFPDIAQNRGFV